VRQGKQPPGVVGQDLPRPDEAYPAADAVKQLDAEGVFQLPHLLGRRWLADGQALGPQAHVAGLGHGVEDGQVVQVHVNNSKLSIL
jgi:hypothetical protein